MKTVAIKPTVTIDQAAMWFAVTNLGGPFVSWSPRKSESADIRFSTGRGISSVVPISGRGCETIYHREHQCLPELEQALPDEFKYWRKVLKKAGDRKRMSAMLEKECGLRIE